MSEQIEQREGGFASRTLYASDETRLGIVERTLREFVLLEALTSVKHMVAGAARCTQSAANNL